MNRGIEVLTIVLFTIYISSLLFLFVYGCVQVHLVTRYLRYKRRRHAPKAPALNHYPLVTVQLPVYNESLVIERLIDAVAQFDYPKDRFEVQVLDDSTDNTTAIIAAKADALRRQGLQIAHIRRPDRSGFKAGALQYGLSLARGEFITLFDADFVPQADFLQQTLPAFNSANTGMVQTRWAHLNKQHSLLTHLQAFLLDAHFSVEQMGRNSSGYLINFSGTGGVWRKACMKDAGGWHSDTLTEDFDISYRAQLKGWQFVYLENVSVPAELPPVMSALKTQQYRWIKGNAETARKHIVNVLHSNLAGKAKLHACFHLMVGLVFICVFVSSFLSVPLLFLKPYVPALNSWFNYASFSVISLLCLGVFHYVSTVKTGFTKENTRDYFFKTFPLYLTFSMGISLNNAIAVVEAWTGRRSAFIRTPKFAMTDNGSLQTVEEIPATKRNLLLPIEIGLSCYYLFAGTYIAFYNRDFTMLPYHLMLSFGFGMIAYFALREQKWFRELWPFKRLEAAFK